VQVGYGYPQHPTTPPGTKVSVPRVRIPLVFWWRGQGRPPTPTIPTHTHSDRHRYLGRHRRPLGIISSRPPLPHHFHTCSDLFGVGFVSETPVQSVLGAAQTPEQQRTLSNCGAKYNQKELYDKLKEACYIGDERSVENYLDKDAPICSHKYVYEYKNTNSPSIAPVHCMHKVLYHNPEHAPSHRRFTD
jgi:hypothetical protein